MCIVFIFHYPRTRLFNCQSKPLYKRFHTGPVVGWWSYLAPLASTFDAMDWTNASVVQEFKDSLENDQYFYVYGHDNNQVGRHPNPTPTLRTGWSPPRPTQVHIIATLTPPQAQVGRHPTHQLDK